MCVLFDFLLTIFTQSKELYPMTGDLERTSLFRLLIDVGILRHMKIFYQTALFANQMIVLRTIGFETVKRAAKGKFLNKTLLHKNFKIPVNSPKA
jgi:hypothetical protein